MNIHVIDDAMPNPVSYRARALEQPFVDIPAGAQVFHGMAPIAGSALAQLLADRFGLVTTFSAFRLSPAGQVEPNYVHEDTGMGTWTAVLYLNPDPPDGDGTIFWKNYEADAWRTVAAKFNRLLLFDAALLHSRALFDNYGTDAASARLVQIAFGTGTLPAGD